MASLHNFQLASVSPRASPELKVAVKANFTKKLEHLTISAFEERLRGSVCNLNEVSQHVSTSLENDYGGIWLTIIKPTDVEIGMVAKSARHTVLAFKNGAVLYHAHVIQVKCRN